MSRFVKKRPPLVAVGIVMASLLFVKRMSDIQISEARLVSDPAEAPDLSEEESAILQRAL